MCPAQIYCSAREVSRVVWAQLLLIKDFCTYRINSGVDPEVMPHCAQKLFYIRVTKVMRNSCVNMTWLRDALGIFWTSHHPAVCPVMSTRPCSWIPHTRCHHSSPGELLSSAFRVCKHSQLISLASGRGIIFQPALYYIQPLFLRVTHTRLLNPLVLWTEAKMNSWYTENTYPTSSCSRNNKLDGINQLFLGAHPQPNKRSRRENPWLLVGDSLGSQEHLTSKVLPDKRAAKIWAKAPEWLGCWPKRPQGVATLQSRVSSTVYFI